MIAAAQLRDHWTGEFFAYIAIMCATAAADLTLVTRLPLGRREQAILATSALLLVGSSASFHWQFRKWRLEAKPRFKGEILLAELSPYGPGRGTKVSAKLVVTNHGAPSSMCRWQAMIELPDHREHLAWSDSMFAKGPGPSGEKNIIHEDRVLDHGEKATGWIIFDTSGTPSTIQQIVVYVFDYANRSWPIEIIAPRAKKIPAV